jgi:hypothetical protein
MKHHVYRVFAQDVRRFRPLVALIISILVLVPSLVAMATQDLSPLVVLLRFVEIVIVVGILVWWASSIVLHYARIQARVTPPVENDIDIRA